VVGYLYNLRWRGWAYSYQSGFRYETGADCRPGLVCHLLAMRRYRDEGLTGYRFLAGDSRYKTSLATERDTLSWLVACRPDWGHRLEDWARAALRRVKSLTAAHPEEP
jgi:CelD/BcsL family acetyltransferase involved in cellulose biosynthesis